MTLERTYHVAGDFSSCQPRQLGAGRRLSIGSSRWMSGATFFGLSGAPRYCFVVARCEARISIQIVVNDGFLNPVQAHHECFCKIEPLIEIRHQMNVGAELQRAPPRSRANPDLRLRGLAGSSVLRISFLDQSRSFLLIALDRSAKDRCCCMPSPAQPCLRGARTTVDSRPSPRRPSRHIEARNGDHTQSLIANEMERRRARAPGAVQKGGVRSTQGPVPHPIAQGLCLYSDRRCAAMTTSVLFAPAPAVAQSGRQSATS